MWASLMSKMTIKELADEIGVSKTAINKKATRAIRKKYFTKVANRFEISLEGQKAIKLLFTDQQPPTENQQLKEKKTTTTQTSSQTTASGSKTYPVADVSDNAMKIIEDYQSQLKEKDKQLAQLHKLLDQQQQLTSQTNEQLRKLKIEFSNEKPDGEISKKGFFSRLFNM